MTIPHSLATPAFPRVQAERLAQALAFVREHAPFIPKLALLWDTCLGNIPELSRHAFPNTAFAGANAFDTSLDWSFGELGKKQYLLLANASALEVANAFIIHVLAELGVQRLLVVKHARPLNPHFVPGEVMLIDDHINFTFTYPLRGQHRKEWGERWPDMSAPYSPSLQNLALALATKERIPLRRGVLLAMHAHTSAELQLAKRTGADALAAFSVAEILTAISRRMQVLGLARLGEAIWPTHIRAEETSLGGNAMLIQFLQSLIKRIG